MIKIEDSKREREERHLKNIGEAIRSLKGSLDILEGAELGMDKRELIKELKVLQGKKRELEIKLEVGKDKNS